MFAEAIKRLKVKEKGRQKKEEALGAEARYCSFLACRAEPSVPLPYIDSGGGGHSGHSFNPEVWKAVRSELPLAFPVFPDAHGNPYQEPLDFKVIKTLA